MKQILLFFIGLHTCLSCHASSIPVCIDERVELTSIVFRLAGVEEYVNNNIAFYTHDIDIYFESCQSHPLIEYIKTLRKNQEIAYDAIATSAFLFTIEDGSIKLNRELDLSEYLALVGRWTLPSIKKYIGLLNDFYKKSDFHNFFSNHKDLYAKTIQSNSALFDKINMEWFASFYGYRIEHIKVYISLCNGVHSYALPEYKAAAKGIIIGCSTIINETPLVNESAYPTVIHEFAHYYTNPITSKYLVSFRASMDQLYDLVASKMTNIGYGSGVVMAGEWLNELFTNLYLRENGDSGLLLYNIARDENNGFIWMNRAFRFMDNFYSDRKLYPTINEFMPQIEGFVNSLPEIIPEIFSEYENRHPYIVNTYPANRSVVSDEITELRITFSRPMISSSGFRVIGDKMLYDPNRIYWSNDKRTMYIPIGGLSANHSYGIELTNYSYIGDNGHKLDNNYILTFQTR